MSGFKRGLSAHYSQIQERIGNGNHVRCAKPRALQRSIPVVPSRFDTMYHVDSGYYHCGFRILPGGFRIEDTWRGYCNCKASQIRTETDEQEIGSSQLSARLHVMLCMELQLLSYRNIMVNKTGQIYLRLERGTSKAVNHCEK